jgi:hypothetical protein
MRSFILKSFVLCLFYLSAATIAKAQNFAPVGAKWYYTQYDASGPGIGYTWFESEKDTVVQGQPCRKIIGQGSCAFVSPYLFDRNDSVFFYHSQRHEFCLLYHFGAAIGDTWTVYHYNESDSTVLMVDSIGIFNVDGAALRTIHTSVVNQGENQYIFGGTLIERIGAAYLFPVIEMCDMGPSELRCYDDPDISFHQGPYECEEVTTSIDEGWGFDNIIVYPNPFSDYLSIELLKGKRENIGLIITSMSGQVVIRSSFDGQADKVVIDLRYLDSGIYFLTISNRTIQSHLKIFKA